MRMVVNDPTFRGLAAHSIPAFQATIRHPSFTEHAISRHGGCRCASNIGPRSPPSRNRPKVLIDALSRFPERKRSMTTSTRRPHSRSIGPAFAVDAVQLFDDHNTHSARPNISQDLLWWRLRLKLSATGRKFSDEDAKKSSAAPRQSWDA